MDSMTCGTCHTECTTWVRLIPIVILRGISCTCSLPIPRNIIRSHSPRARSNPLRYFTSTRRCITRPRVTRPAMHGVDQAWRRLSAMLGVLEGRWLLEKASTRMHSYVIPSKRRSTHNGLRRRRFIAQCQRSTGADISALIISMASKTNAFRPGSLKRQIDFVDLRDLKARLTNDPALLQNTITDGPAFADQDTGDDMYPVLKQENTSSYIYRRAIPRGITRLPMSFPLRGITRSAMLYP